MSPLPCLDSVSEWHDFGHQKILPVLRQPRNNSVYHEKLKRKLVSPLHVSAISVSNKKQGSQSKKKFITVEKEEDLRYNSICTMHSFQLRNLIEKAIKVLPLHSAC